LWPQLLNRQAHLTPPVKHGAAALPPPPLDLLAVVRGLLRVAGRLEQRRQALVRGGEVGLGSLRRAVRGLGSAHIARMLE
jgi:hypothetical protein